MSDEEMDLLVDRLAGDGGSWRRLKAKVESQRTQLLPAAPVPKDEEGWRWDGESEDER